MRYAKSTYFEQSNKIILVFRTSKFNMSLATPITTFREILDGLKFKRQLQQFSQHNLLNGYKIKKNNLINTASYISMTL